MNQILFNILHYRDTSENGVFEMVYTFTKFDVEVLRSSPAYKYSVVTKEGQSYEYLHCYEPKESNRCLFFPKAEPGGKHVILMFLYAPVASNIMCILNDFCIIESLHSRDAQSALLHT